MWDVRLDVEDEPTFTRGVLFILPSQGLRSMVEWWGIDVCEGG